MLELEKIEEFAKLWERESVEGGDGRSVYVLAGELRRGEVPVVGEYNCMHVMGLLICSLLQKNHTMQVDTKDFSELLGEFYEKIWLHEKKLHEMNIKEIKDLLSCFQIYFKEMMFMTGEGGTGRSIWRSF